MRRLVVAWLVVAWLVVASLLAACTSSQGREVRADLPRADPAPATLRGTVAAVNAFAVDLHHAIGPPDQNQVTAPLAVVLGLGMSRAGARGATREALDRALHADRSTDLDAGLDTVVLSLANAEGEQRSDLRKGEVTLDLAASLWTQTDTSFEQAYLDRLATYYGAGVRVVDFRSTPDAARDTINGWGETATDGRVTEVLARGSIHELTRFVIPSVGSVRAPWEVRFDPDDTTVGSFTLADGRTVEAPMMTARDADSFGTATGEGWQALAVPYLGDELAFVVVLPTTGDLAALDRAMGPSLIDEILDALEPRPLEVRLPRFAFTTAVDLERPLTDLGLGVAFSTDEADFSGITTDEPLAVWRAAHQTFVSVDEEGSDAEAATVVPADRATVTRADRVVVDRPFVFAVVHRRTGLVVQLGRVVDPTR